MPAKRPGRELTTLGVLCGILPLVACVPIARDAYTPQLPDTLTDRVARERSCPRERIVVMPQSGDTYEAIACDKRATFSCMKHVYRTKGAAARYSDSCMQRSPWIDAH